MKSRNCILGGLTLAFIGATAGFLAYWHSHQRLGHPGVKTSAIEGSQRLQVELPEWALDYTSTNVPVSKTVCDVLPADTSFGQRLYQASDGFQVEVNVVLMGSDRTSLHKPQICLRGTGWNIARTEKEVVHVPAPKQYDLPVMKLTLVPEKPGSFNGAHGVYVYWFAAENEYTREHWQRMWWMFKDLVTTGVLQRWAYITYFATCAPGQEEAAFERIKKLIAASVPDYQAPPRTGALLSASK